MVHDYIKLFIRLVRHGSRVNTYKLAWAKAIVEIAMEQPGIQKITLEQIARKVFKYYWNHTIYFDLIQGNNPNKRPQFVAEVRKQIEGYYAQKDERMPIHFEKVEDSIKLNLPKLVRILKQDVSYRFPILNGQELPVYQYTRGDDQIEIEHSELLAEYSDMLFDIINFKWTQALETFNFSPRVAKKVRVLDLDTIERKPLTPFKPYLDLENPGHICFMCDGVIKDGLSIDHVIPWSFIFSDDLWNLVYTHKECNSSKSNIVPSEVQIARLETRNLRLQKLLAENPEICDKKPFRELELAIEKDYVRKFWINCIN